MTDYPTYAEKGTDPRGKFVELGVDDSGAHHIYHPPSETVHIVHADGSRGRRVIAPDQEVDEYVKTVDDARGWAVQKYHLDPVAGLAARIKVRGD